MRCSAQIFAFDFAACVILLASIGTVQCTAAAQKFLSPSTFSQPLVAGLSINTTLDTILASGNGVSSKHLAKISAGLQHIFQALPKNDVGRLTPRAVRHIVHTYFAREHGWLIKGLEPHGMSTLYSKLHEANILVDNLPALAAALADSNQCDMGFSFDDSVALTAALERAILDESLGMLDMAYELNGYSVKDTLTESELHSVLTSFLLLYETGADNIKKISVDKHQAFKKTAEEVVDSWPLIVDFERDSVLNFMYDHMYHTNPFKSWEFSFQSATKIVDIMTKSYGKWQNRECFQMKDVLVGIAGDASGKVPLGRFYADRHDSDSFSFTETEDDLRELGALEESARGPLVRIPNYLAGPSNCIAASSYYSVCCLNECELIMRDLEDTMKAPSATPEFLLDLVGDMSSSTIDAPRNMSQELQSRLYEIAARHNGQVPIYGRLFAEWLHHAFPSECQYPHIVGGAAELAPRRWQGSQGHEVMASEEEKQKHIQASAGFDHASEVAAVEWLDDEVLLLEEPDVDWWPQNVCRMMLALVAQIAVFATMCSLARAMWLQATAGFSIWQGHDKQHDKQLVQDLMLHI